MGNVSMMQVYMHAQSEDEKKWENSFIIIIIIIKVKRV